MRTVYIRQLERLNDQLIHMGRLCEDAISCAQKVMLEHNNELLLSTVLSIEEEINRQEREIDVLCHALILHQQPVASSLRFITSAQKMISDMERIGDQAADFATIAWHLPVDWPREAFPFNEMIQAVGRMLAKSIESFIRRDLELAQSTILQDDEIDLYFSTVKKQLGVRISQDESTHELCLDLLMIAKYLERIGDHAENIAKWVIYSITGHQAS